jgi:hypothetical protein
MAFTLSEQQQIRTYLGYSDRNLTANAWLNSSLGQVTAESESAVRSILLELAGIDTQLATVRAKRFQVSEIEGIKLHGPGETKSLFREGARLANRIGVILGVECKEDVYSTGNGSGSMPLG